MSRNVAPGDTVAGYRIDSVLGRGGMAVVYLAEHDRLKRKVALKVLSPEISGDETFRRRFVAESERLASVDHPNIIPIYEAGEDGELLFIAMRYVDSTDLKHLIAQEGGLDAGRTVSIITQVAGALDAAHAKGLVHRDVKPANVLVATGAGADGGDHAYLSDFGLTKRTEETSGLTRTGYFMGTIDYVAPEQITGKGVDGRTDQYALACVMFECLAGRPPYQKEDDAAVLFSHLSEPPPLVTDVRPDLSGEVNDVIATGMAKEKDDRYPYCVALARAARGALTGRPVTPTAGLAVATPTLPTPPPEPSTVAPTHPAAPPSAREAASPPPTEPAPAPAGYDATTRAAPGIAPPTGPRRPDDGDRRRSRRPLVAAVIAAVLIAGVVGAFALFSDGDERGGGPTGETGTTGSTGATGATGPVGSSLEQIPSPRCDLEEEVFAEACVLGSWNVTFTPDVDPADGESIDVVWDVQPDCTERLGDHPCDLTIAGAASGSLGRQGKTYTGNLNGTLPCGDAQFSVTFDVLDADVIDGGWVAIELGGAVLDSSGGGCGGVAAGDTFTLVATLI